MGESNKSVADRAKMVKVLLRIISVSLFLILGLSFLSEQVRSFYCLSEGKCVTVWKRSGNKCYIVLGKYYGLAKPTGNYIRTTNTAFVDVIWTTDNRLLVDIEDGAQIVQPVSDNSLEIERYSSNKVLNDSAYTYYDGKYNRYNEKVSYIRLYIEEGYATDRAGIKLK